MIDQESLHLILLKKEGDAQQDLNIEIKNFKHNNIKREQYIFDKRDGDNSDLNNLIEDEICESYIFVLACLRDYTNKNTQMS